jgi:hypothetical protein
MHKFRVLATNKLVKFDKKKSIKINKKLCLIFGQNIKILAHSENFKSAKTYLLPYFQPLWAKNVRNLSENFIKNN